MDDNSYNGTFASDDRPRRPCGILTMQIGVGACRMALGIERKKRKAKLADLTDLMTDKDAPMTYRRALAYLDDLEERGYGVVPITDDHITPNDPRRQQEEFKHLLVGATPIRVPNEDDLRRYRADLYRWFSRPENQGYVPDNEEDANDLALACREALEQAQAQVQQAGKVTGHE